MTEWSGVKVYFEYSQFSKSVKKTKKQKLYEWLCKFCSIWIKRQITCDHSEVPKEPPVPGPFRGQEGPSEKKLLAAGEKEDVEEPRMLLAAVPTALPLVLFSQVLILPSVSLGRVRVYLSLEPMSGGPIRSLSCRVTCPGQSGSRCWGHCVSQCVACDCPQGLRKDAHIEVTVSEALIPMCLLSFF